MRFTKKFLGVFLLLLPLLLTNTINAFGTEEDDYTPDVTARVARINVLRGDVQIRRAGATDWERATLNLPLVEGDEITTSLGARLEIQFNSSNYARLSENSYLKITTLRDEGVALSLPQGTLSLRAFEFNKDKAYFEIDAPKTTIAVQQPGMYRIDAGDNRSTEIRVTVTEEGLARIYSDNNGSTLKSGRSMRIFLDGNLAGEWDIADAARYADEFDSWALERDTVIAKRLRDAYYDKYYDREIYGADDLNENGEWIYTKKYGYVWRPYGNVTARYADWSPYRYGHWRWIPPFGWTWVNDEPWGWATYHYGRWVYVDRNWCWTPYAYYRTNRSWWSPALVVVTYSGSYICWYPLPYNYGYYNYNYTVINTTIIKNTTVIVNPTPNASPTPAPVVASLPGRGEIPPFQWIPTTGVVTVPINEFGTGKTNYQTAPTKVAEEILSKVPDEKTSTPPLPTIKDLSGKVSRDIVTETPKIAKTDAQIKTGVIERQPGISMNDKLQNERVLDNRPPIEKNSDVQVKSDKQIRNNDVRDTGAVKRQPPVMTQDNNTLDTPVKPSRQNTTKSDDENNPPIRSTGGGKTDRENNPPVRNPQNEKTDRDDNPPVRVPQKEERNEQPPVKPPVYVPPVREQQPQQQPKKEEQKPQEKPKQEQPKSDRKTVDKID